jgi:hypothetical protein
MLKVKIESVTGFGKTAEFATIQLMHYDLGIKTASAIVNLFEADPTPSAPAPGPAVPFIMSKTVNCTPEEVATWGTDDLVFIDLVLAKSGVTRDADWVQPAPQVETPVAGPESSTEPEEETQP